MLKWQLNTIALNLLKHVNKALRVIPGPQYKKYVLTKMFLDPTLVDLVLESKSVTIQQEIISGFMNTLTIVKNPCSYMKLASKHALLVATINNVDTFSSMR
jgi:hypothetical protein